MIETKLWGTPFDLEKVIYTVINIVFEKSCLWTKALLGKFEAGFGDKECLSYSTFGTVLTVVTFFLDFELVLGRTFRH